MMPFEHWLMMVTIGLVLILIGKALLIPGGDEDDGE
jgi:hypothetical protein